MIDTRIQKPPGGIPQGGSRLSKKLRFFDKGDCTPKGSRFSSKSCRTFWGVKCDFRCTDNRKSRFKFYFAAACARRRVSERNRRLRRLLARRCGETLRGLFPASGGFLKRSSPPAEYRRGARFAAGAVSYGFLMKRLPPDQPRWRAASTKPRNSGWGRLGRLKNSGWNWAARKKGWSGSSISSTSRPSGLVPARAMPWASMAAR